MIKNKKWSNWLIRIFTIIFLFLFAGCEVTDEITTPRSPGINQSISQESINESPTDKEQSPSKTDTTKVKVKKGQSYTSKDEVAAYIHEFKELPPNYITKKEAQKSGWDSSKGNLWEVTDKKSIGGDVFGNYESLLPEPDYYGENLDALWDCLLEDSSAKKITLYNIRPMVDNLGSYGERIINLLERAAKENENIVVYIERDNGI